jgi:hypothetical protein
VREGTENTEENNPERRRNGRRTEMPTGDDCLETKRQFADRNGGLDHVGAVPDVRP